MTHVDSTVPTHQQMTNFVSSESQKVLIFFASLQVQQVLLP